jgi:restriction system protein
MATADASSKRPLTQLNHEIEEAEAEASRLETARAAVAKEAARAARRLRYLRLARWFRRPAASFELWPMAALLVGSVIVGIMLLITVHVLTGYYPLAFFAFLLGTVAGVGVIGALIYYPADTLLPSAITEAESETRLGQARLEEKRGRIAEVKERLGRLLEERRDHIASGKLQRAALLQRNWKSMRGAEWEDFVVEVLRTHGAAVERTQRSGGEDANLIADFGARRIAIFTEAEAHNVSSETIRQALAAKERYRCDSSAVIINRRFTGAAQDFAQRNGCSAIGTAEFPDFVLGKIAL